MELLAGEGEQDIGAIDELDLGYARCNVSGVGIAASGILILKQQHGDRIGQVQVNDLRPGGVKGGFR
jgi:hypothetical protein